MKLQYNKPASISTEALPIGNGRLGAMIFGGVEKERIGLNEDTLWSGYPKDCNNPGAKEAMPQVRKLLEEGRYAEADIETKQMMGPYTQSFLPFGDLHLSFEHGNKYDSYHRELDLANGLSSVEYRIGNITYKGNCSPRIRISLSCCGLKQASEEPLMSMLVWIVRFVIIQRQPGSVSL